MLALTIGQLTAGMPNLPIKTAAVWLDPLNRAMASYQVDKPAEIAAFLATIAAESGELRYLRENMDYSAERLCQVWPSRFPTICSAMQYAHHPEKLGNYIYAARMGNGSEESGDGYRLRGVGPMMMTGTDNLRRLGALMGLDLVADPSILMQPVEGSFGAAAFWWDRRLDDAVDRASIARVTRIVQGGTQNLAQRQSYFDAFKRALAI